MQCPSCQSPLIDKRAGGITTAVCSEECGGLWFGRAALKKLHDRLPAAGKDLLPSERAAGVHLFRDVEHICPQCRNTVLYRHCFSRLWEYEIDQCPKCAGFWVEVGRLAELSRDLNSAQNRERLAEYYRSLFDDKVANMNLYNHDTLEAAQQIVRIFVFLGPRETLPKKLPL